MSFQPSPRPPLAEEPARARGPWGCLLGGFLVTIVVLVGAYAGLQWLRSGITLGGEACQASAIGATISFSPEQMDNAGTIVGIAMGRGLPARAGTIAIATAIQESKLRNINYGDRDSLGLFQQRPSQGWGTEAEILDPVYSTHTFYDALVKVPGWDDMVVTEIAQEVQRSAFPDAYADHETEGRVIASTLAGHTQASMVCRLDSPTHHTDSDALLADLRSHLGVSGTVSDDGATFTLDAPNEQVAWSVGQYLVAKAERHAVMSVQVSDQVWTRSRQDSALQWHTGADQASPTRVVATLNPPVA